MKDFTIDGFVAQNVETKATQSGRMVTKFSVNSPDYDRKTQERTPQYFDCEFWHDQGDPKAAMIQEGALLLVWGQLHQDKWTDRNTGQNRSKVVLRAREVAQIRAPQPGRQQGRPQQPAAYARRATRSPPRCRRPTRRPRRCRRATRSPPSTPSSPRPTRPPSRRPRRPRPSPHRHRPPSWRSTTRTSRSRGPAMQVLDSLIDGPLQLSNAREGDELIGMMVRYLRTGAEPSPRTDAQRMALAMARPVLDKSRARIEGGRAGGSANGARTGRDADAEGRERDAIPYAEVVAALNRAAGTAFRDTSKKTRSLIRARWAEGYRLEDFEAVVEEKAAQWSGDANMRAYLRPETLFSPKFEGYREEARAAAQRPGKGALDAYAEL